MRRPPFAALVALTLLVVFGSGCLYSHITLPLDTNLQETELGSKVGRSSFKSVLWLVAWGDAGTQAAARDGGIRVLRHADTERFVVFFGLYYTQHTIVYGD